MYSLLEDRKRGKKKNDTLELDGKKQVGKGKDTQTSSGQEKGLGLAAAWGSGQALAGIFEMLCSGWEERWIKSMKVLLFPQALQMSQHQSKKGSEYVKNDEKPQEL